MRAVSDAETPVLLGSPEPLSVAERVLVPVVSGQVYVSLRLLVQALRVIRLVAPLVPLAVSLIPLVSLAVPLISVMSRPETLVPLQPTPGQAV
jgi:hypothetical protein